MNRSIDGARSDHLGRYEQCQRLVHESHIMFVVQCGEHVSREPDDGRTITLFLVCEAFGCMRLVFSGMGCLIYLLGSSCVHLFCNVSIR